LTPRGIIRRIPDPLHAGWVYDELRKLAGRHKLPGQCGDGTFQTFRTFASDSGTSSLVCGDFDQDGWIDLVVQSSSGVKLWANDRIW
jgi:hypothetical protein